ncbi:unnamed protein product [Dibothriocephalus latus]|uniref:Uncharacterized protein n=1 Tax=Dibothriocephalus latus TaxID=60516 RepID=A0A3P7P8M0_DIBLA|nr:unnamed protein product [Dibothriocephalus latus]
MIHFFFFFYQVLGVEKFVPQQRRDQAEKRKANTTAAAETDASVPKVSRVEGEDVEAPPAAAVPEGSEAEPCTDGGGQA